MNERNSPSLYIYIHTHRYTCYLAIVPAVDEACNYLGAEKCDAINSEDLTDASLKDGWQLEEIAAFVTDISNSFLLASCSFPLPSFPKEEESFGKILSTNFIYVKSRLGKKKSGRRIRGTFSSTLAFKDGGG